MNYASSVVLVGGSQRDKPKALVVAPTEMAASLVNSSTLHSTVQLKFGDELDNLSDNSLDNLHNSLEDLASLIFNEKSRIRADFVLSTPRKASTDPTDDRLFGGVSILLFGDLLQLKPVQGRYIFPQPRCQKYADFHEFCNLWTQFQSVVLKANHRSVHVLFFFPKKFHVVHRSFLCIQSKR